MLRLSTTLPLLVIATLVVVPYRPEVAAQAGYTGGTTIIARRGGAHKPPVDPAPTPTPSTVTFPMVKIGFVPGSQSPCDGDSHTGVTLVSATPIFVAGDVTTWVQAVVTVTDRKVIKAADNLYITVTVRAKPNGPVLFSETALMCDLIVGGCPSDGVPCGPGVPITLSSFFPITAEFVQALGGVPGTYYSRAVVTEGPKKKSNEIACFQSAFTFASPDPAKAAGTPPHGGHGHGHRRGTRPGADPDSGDDNKDVKDGKDQDKTEDKKDPCDDAKEGEKKEECKDKDNEKKKAHRRRRHPRRRHPRNSDDVKKDDDPKKNCDGENKTNPPCDDRKKEEGSDPCDDSKDNGGDGDDGKHDPNRRRVDCRKAGCGEKGKCVRRRRRSSP